MCVCVVCVCVCVCKKVFEKDVALVDFVYLVGLFTGRLPSEGYRWRFRPLLLCSCDIFRVLIISLFVD